MRSIVALAYTLLMAVLAAAVPFHEPGTLGLVVRDCNCQDSSDGSCTCADTSPLQRLHIDFTTLDCKECMDSGKPCACAPPDAQLFHCLCTNGRTDGQVEPCSCNSDEEQQQHGVAARGLIGDLLREPPSKDNNGATTPKSVFCGEGFRLGKSSTCSGNHGSASFDRRNAASRWGLLGKLIPGGRPDSKKGAAQTPAHCGKSLRLWEPSSCGGAQDQATLQCMCQDKGVNGKARPCPCNGPNGDSIIFLGNKV